MKKRKIVFITFAILILFNYLFSIYILYYFISNKPQSTSSLYNNTIEKTVEIRCFNSGQEKIGYATGVIVSKNGDILTNRHVVLNQNVVFENIQVRFFNDENFIDAVIKKIDNENDLALITININTPSYFQIGEHFNAGDKVYTIGNPNGFGLSFSSGVISSAKRIVTYNNTSILSIQTSIIINEGNSGGPLFNEKAELIGLISFRLKDSSGEVIQGVSFALHRDLIFDFLK